jgi:hypothetical protein
LASEGKIRSVQLGLLQAHYHQGVLTGGDPYVVGMIAGVAFQIAENLDGPPALKIDAINTGLEIGDRIPCAAGGGHDVSVPPEFAPSRPVNEAQGIAIGVCRNLSGGPLPKRRTRPERKSEKNQ